MKQELIAKLEDRSAVIGIVGLGYVFNHDPMMLALFSGLMAIGIGQPMLANYWERRAAQADEAKGA